MLRTAESQPSAEYRPHNPEQGLIDDTTTWLAEVLDGRMRTPFEYEFDGHELYGRDGVSLKPVFEEALVDAKRLVRKNPNLAFELRRRQIELNEYRDMLSMMKGEAPNTIVVVSDFPPELMDAGEDVGGYNVKRRQTMLRVLCRTEDGKLSMRSQSLDYSDRGALEAIYKTLGTEAKEGELLGQRIKVQLSSSEQEFLVDHLMGVYDRAMNAQYGGNWYAGRLDGSSVNTYDFVRAQTDLLEAFMQNPSRDNLGNLAAAMENRFEKMNMGRQIDEGLLPANLAQLEINTAGFAARAINKVYSGCGLTLGGKQSETQNELNALGYGNKTSETTDYKFDKYMHCVVCQAPPGPKTPKKMCGPCGICKDCDSSIRRKNR